MDFLIPKYRRNPNEKIHSLYQGLGSGGVVISRVVKPSLDGQHMEAVQTVEGMQPVQRGQGGRVGVLVLGGMETTLDEIEYILEMKKQKPFVPRRTQGEIAEMCYTLLERRNSLIRHWQKNPSEKPKKRRTVRLYLPRGVRLMKTPEPGLKIYAQNPR